MSPGRDWLGQEHGDLAAQRLLDAAGALFATQGVRGVGLADVARQAGCSRATLYRYFESRDTLRTAFIDREARRIALQVGEAMAGIADPAARLVEGILEALRLVRANPALSAWFTDADSGLTTALAHSSRVIETMTAAWLGDPSDLEMQRRGRWLTRVIVSLLAGPGRDDDDERDMIERFVAPVLVGAGQASLSHP